MKKRTLKWFCGVLGLVMLVLGGAACKDQAWKDEQGSQGLLYEMLEGEEAYVVAGIGTCADTEIEIPNKHEGIPIVGIKEKAFSANRKITSVVMKENIRFIEARAFYRCEALANVTLGEGLEEVARTAFEECNALEQMEYEHGYYLGTKKNPYYLLTRAESDYYQHNLHEDTVVIQDSAFANNDVVKGINLGQALKYIGDQAFLKCDKLEEITFPLTLQGIGAQAFCGCTQITEVILPEGMVFLGEEAFSGIESLKTATVWGSEIEAKVFAYSGLESVEIHAEIIGSKMFTDCESLADVTIGSEVKEIADEAFSMCDSLVDIEIPDSVTTIGMFALASCPNLVNVSIGNGVEEIGEQVFIGSNNIALNQMDGGYFLGNSANPLLIFMGVKDGSVESFTLPKSTKILYDSAKQENGLKSLTFGGEIVDMDAYAFEDCQTLENLYYTGSVEDWCKYEFSVPNSNPIYHADNFYMGGELVTELSIPNAITEISSYAFYGLKSLTKLHLSNSVKTIGTYAFFGCSSLDDVDLGSVEKIEEKAFGACYSMRELVIPDSVLLIENGAFEHCSNLTELTLPFFGESRESTREKGVLGYIFGMVKTDNSREANFTTQYRAGEYCHYLIPSSLSKITFTGEIVKEGALINCEYIEDVVIGDNATEIQEKAFFGCTGLRNVTIGSKVKKIGSAAFKDESFSMNAGWAIENVYYTGTAGGWAQIEVADKSATPLYRAQNFYVQNETLTELIIEDGVTEIKAYAFYNRYEIKKIEIADSVASIAGDSFFGVRPISLKMPYCMLKTEEKHEHFLLRGIFSTQIQETLEFLHITKGVVDGIVEYRKLKEIVLGGSGDIVLERGAIIGNQSLTKITIEKGLLSIEYDGIDFYSGTTNELYYNGTVEDWCQIEIQDSDFLLYVDKFYIDGELVTDLVIPDTVTKISSYAFACYKNLRSVTIGRGVAHIGYRVFEDCDNLETITYQGTVDEWKAIETAKNWCGDAPAGKVYCQDGEVEINK